LLRSSLFEENESTTFNIGVIKRGEAPGVVADKCVIEGNIVFSAYTRETLDSLFGKIENVLQISKRRECIIKEVSARIREDRFEGKS